MAKRVKFPLLVIGLGVAFAAAVRKVFGMIERPSWPPPPDAVTGDGAAEAVADFASTHPVPRDVDLSYAWSTAASIEPWGGGEEFFPRLFDDIRAAESSIHILMFGWKPGVPAEELTEVLIGKLQAGVEVRILVDEFGSRPYGVSQEMYERLAEAGAEIVVNSFVPPRKMGLYPNASTGWSKSLICRADHRKLYVIDGSVAWMGGAGVEDHFLDGRFFDVMVQVKGDVVRLAQSIFLTSFTSHRAELPDDLAPYFPVQPEPGTTPAVITQVVQGGHVSATQAARELIDGATRRLDIMNPYLTDDDMIGRIIAAARRGAAVRVVVSQKSNNAFATHALRHRYTELLDAGVEVWEYPGAVVHAKLIVADDQVQFGTLNLDAWALYRNYEVAMIVSSREAADRFAIKIFAPVIERSERGAVAVAVRDRVLDAFASRTAYFI